MGTDAGYVQSLARIQRDLHYPAASDPKQQLNLMLALASPAFSDYLATVAANQALGWLRSLS